MTPRCAYREGDERCALPAGKHTHILMTARVAAKVRREGIKAGETPGTIEEMMRRATSRGKGDGK